MADEKPSLSYPLFLLLLFYSLHAFFIHSAYSQSFIGVNYGQVADNLPPPSRTATLLKSTTIAKIRLYGADPAILRALSGTGIGVVIGASNGEIPSLAANPAAASQWIASNVLPFYPSTQIILISVGNEVFSSGDPNLPSQLLPAMQNLHSALQSASIADKIKISTVHSMAVLGQSDPPSSGAFQASLTDTMKSLLGFLQSTGSPFTINPYPYFAYRSDTRPETLAFCLFQPNQGRFDAGSRITYMNMFDAQVDAVRSALNGAGSKDTEIVIAETGWPYNGDADEVGATVENAKAFNGGLISHLRSMVGTPLMPGKSVDTYIFALYDEDLKPGPTSERSFGLFRPDGTVTYDVGLAKSGQTAAPAVGPPSSPSSTKGPAGYCVPTPGVSDAQLQANLDYACGQGIDCTPIQPGGACYLPNTVASHAAYAMNLFYQKSEKKPLDCDFSKTAALIPGNPSYNKCIYPGS